MLTRWLSRYHPHYIRSLVYMLQSSEYSAREFLTWYRRVNDFRIVEQRKRLDPTIKAIALLCSTYIVGVTVYITVALLSISGTALSSLYATLLLLSLPYVLLLWLLVVAALLRFAVQLPVTILRKKQARSILDAHPAQRIAIAGSYGKTSMREILRTVLGEANRVAAPPGSYNTALGISSFVTTLQGDEDILLFELGEYYPGDVRELAELTKPHLGVITGVNESHLEKFKDVAITTTTVFELADYLHEQPLYVNGESKLSAAAARDTHSIYSRDGVDRLRVVNARTDLSGVHFTVNINSTDYDFTSALLGLHHVGPLLAAIAIGLHLGMTIQELQAGVEKTSAFPHRLQPSTSRDGVITLDDTYNGNPDGVTAVIDFLASLTSHRRWYVTPGLVEMGSATESVHTTIGHQLATAGIEQVVLIRNSVTPFIAQGLSEGNFSGELLWYDDAIRAYRSLPSLTIASDVVLLQNDWPDQYV